MGEHGLFWVLFNVFVLGMLALDLFVFHRDAHVIKIKEALGWSCFWIALALIFNGIIYFTEGTQPAIEFLTAYLIEKSLSVDNLFVFIVLFNYFKIPPKYQHKVLFWGIIGALILRATFILVGITLLAKFHFIIYLLGGFLVFTGIRMAMASHEPEINPKANPVVKFISRYIPVTNELVGGKFFVKRERMHFATPLFIVLLMVETTDVVFAMDSIPAILAISRDTFIVYTSNVFALLGLRALYFALAGVMQLFHYLHYGLALILVFIGGKLILSDLYVFDMRYALLVVGAILAVSVIISLLFPKEEDDINLPPTDF